MSDDKAREMIKANSNSVDVSTAFNINANIGFNEAELVQLKSFLTQYVRSEKSGIKSIEDGIAIALRARDLKLPFSSCAEHIHIVSGKTGLDVHITKALLLKGSVTYEKVDNYRALYEYTDGFNVYDEDKLPADVVKVINSAVAKSRTEDDAKNGVAGETIYVYPVKFYKDFANNIYREYQLDSRFQPVANVNDAKTAKAAGKIPIYRIPNVPIDYVTTYKFNRNVGGKVMEITSSFSYKDAEQAELLKKDTYKNYPKVLISHRAFVYGAREIADDLLMGCLSIEEIKTINNIDLSDEDIIDITDLQD